MYLFCHNLIILTLKFTTLPVYASWIWGWWCRRVKCTKLLQNRVVYKKTWYLFKHPRVGFNLLFHADLPVDIDLGQPTQNALHSWCFFYSCPAIFEVPLYIIIDRTCDSCAYMYFPLYKQVVLSEETVFNEGEGDTDPQALHHRIHLLRSLPRTRKITYFCLPLFCSIK